MAEVYGRIYTPTGRMYEMVELGVKFNIQSVGAEADAAIDAIIERLDKAADRLHHCKVPKKEKVTGAMWKRFNNVWNYSEDGGKTWKQ